MVNKLSDGQVSFLSGNHCEWNGLSEEIETGVIPNIFSNQKLTLFK